jgi:hypothetical protein
MADATYPQNRAYQRQDGRLVVPAGATMEVEVGATVTGLAAVVEQTALADLAGTLTGTVDGTIADVANIALSTGDTYTDTAVNNAVNTAIASVNLQLKELQTKLNAALQKLRDANVIADA